MAYLKDEVKAGIIILLSFLILSGSVILIGGSQFFEKFDIYYVRVTNAAGIEVGSQVRLGGVRVGRVLNITAPNVPSEPVTLTIGIRKGTALYKGTKALITQIGFVGDIYLLLSIEETTKDPFRVGEIIPSQEQPDFGRLMARLDVLSQSVGGLIKDVNALFSTKNIQQMESLLSNTNRAIVSGSQNLEKVASALKGTTDKIELVLNEIEGLLRDNKGEFSALIKKTREDLDQAGHMIRAIEKTIQSADKTTQTLDRTIDFQSQNMDILFHTLTRTTEDLQDLLQEIKNKPWSIIYREGKER